MSASILETLRHQHAIIELCKEQMHDDLVDGARGKKEQVLQDHRNKQRIDVIVDCTKKIIPIYDDRDKSFRNELDKMKQRGYIHEFWSKFNEIRKNHQDNNLIPASSDYIQFDDNVQFSGEEWHGRFVDLHEFYKKYLNINVFKLSSSINKINKKRVDYKTFLLRIFEFWRIENNKKNKNYIKFYSELLDYLVDFWKRTHPITPTNAILKKCVEFFENDWKDESIEGWQKPWTKATKQKYVNKDYKLNKNQNQNNNSNGNSNSNGSNDQIKKKNNDKMPLDDDDDDDDQDIDLKQNDNKNNDNDNDDDIDMKNNDNNNNNNNDDDDDDDDDDIDISLSLKYNRGLYCFSCVRKFTNSNTMKCHFQSKKHLNKKKIALLEYKISLFIDLLQEAILGTVEYIEKKQTKTYDEIRSELVEAEKQDDYQDAYYSKYSRYGGVGGGLDDYYHEDMILSDPSILNPLQIPLDFDGKPIPYWLYKFRGLNRYFECQICDEKYRGPRAFERHFREWKHAHHMRMLNIPNTKDFHMITRREDAELLNQKIQQAKNAKSWNPEQEEEFEDNEGNVFKKSMYDQLKRQGVV